MSKRVLSLALIVTALLTAGAPAPADDYNNYKLNNSSWPKPSALTACFYQGKAYYYDNASDGLRYTMVPLPADYRSFIKAASNIWTDTPGIPVNITMVDKCTSTTDITVVGTGMNGGNRGPGGFGGCTYDNDSNNKVSTTYICRARSGIIALNLNISVAQGGKSFWTYTAIHEFGHVAGLDHPTNDPCRNKCVGPVMSYGSCTSKGCVLRPDGSDARGIQVAYPSPDASGCLAVNARTTGLVSIPSISTIATLPDPEDITVPDLELPPVLGQTVLFGAGAVDELGAMVADPLGTLDVTVETLADPAVDAYAVLDGTAGKVWNPIDDVGDIAGRPMPRPPEC